MVWHLSTVTRGLTCHILTMCARPTWQYAIRLAKNKQTHKQTKNTLITITTTMIIILIINNTTTTTITTTNNKIHNHNIFFITITESWTNLEGSLLLANGSGHTHQCRLFHFKGAARVAQKMAPKVNKRIPPQTVSIVISQ